MKRSGRFLPGDASFQRGAALVLGMYVCLSATYQAVIRPGFGPDEWRHTHTVQYLAEEGKLPVALDIFHATGGGHPLHPPLYYAAETPLYYLARPAAETALPRTIRVMRVGSTLWGLAALWQFAWLLSEVFPQRRALCLATLALTAFLPEYLLISSVVLNDIAAVFFGVVLLRQLVWLGKEPCNGRRAVYVGLAMAGFANAKAQLLMLLPLCAGWLAALVIGRKLSGRRALKHGVWAYGVLLLLGSGWYVRNTFLYGQLMPPGLDRWAPHTADGHRLTPMEVYTTGLLAPLLWRSVVGLWVSLWSQPDWFLNPPPPGVTQMPVPAAIPYGLLGVLFAAALAGHVKDYLRRRNEDPAAVPEEKRRQRQVLWLSYAMFALVYGAVTYMAVFVHLGWYQGGRYLYPTIWGFALFLTLGHAALSSRTRRTLVFAFPVALLLLNALCLFNLIVFLNPAYAGG